jgi:argininosuccinate lyase
MSLWGGRFEKETDELAFVFNQSIHFDSELVMMDLQGSIAHVQMLAKQRIIPKESSHQIIVGIEDMIRELESGQLLIDPVHEDIHSFVESELIKRIGDAGKLMHTARSRNDQVALDMRMYTKYRANEISCCLLVLLQKVLLTMKDHTDTVMPGFTHMQKAQPITLAHHYGAYFEMFKRDLTRVRDCVTRMDECPLGAGALAGTTFDIDREMTASLTGFARATSNSLDSVSDRDYIIELLSCCSIIMMHLSRFCEEIIMWNSDEYRYIEIDDTFATGSSMMPQKKNPDIAELVRGKTGRVYGALMSLLTTMKGLPLAYNKDMQEDKEVTFDALDTVTTCLSVFARLLGAITFDKPRMEASAQGGFINATDAADYLVAKGVPFRDAHRHVGELVLACRDRRCTLQELPIDEYKKISPAFADDIYEAVSLRACVNRRNSAGGPGADAIKTQIEACERFLESENGTGQIV